MNEWRVERSLVCREDFVLVAQSTAFLPEEHLTSAKSEPTIVPWTVTSEHYGLPQQVYDYPNIGFTYHMALPPVLRHLLTPRLTLPCPSAMASTATLWLPQPLTEPHLVCVIDPHATPFSSPATKVLLGHGSHQQVWFLVHPYNSMMAQ